jgi:hypothetical protein
MLFHQSETALASKADFRVYLAPAPQVRRSRRHVYTIQARRCREARSRYQPHGSSRCWHIELYAREVPVLLCKQLPRTRLFKMNTEADSDERESQALDGYCDFQQDPRVALVGTAQIQKVL